MEKKICSAIDSNTFLEFEYDGHCRVVKPFKLFKSRDGEIAMEGVQVGGKSESGSMPFWRTFNIEKISSIEETGGPNSVHGSDRVIPDTEDKYNPDDDRYEEVICLRRDS